MRKQTKLVAVLSAAALLAIGASMTSFAAGWTQEDGEWVYLNSDGERATETWKRSGDYYYWFDENGDIAKNQIIEHNENYYYVNEDGVRVSNQWVAVDNKDDVYVDNKEVSVLWYYLGSTGRAYKAADNSMYKNAVIDGSRYLFDEYGHMVTGWVNVDNSEDTYYLGDENQGWAHTGWQWLEIPEEIESNYDVDEAWFYFNGSGKAKKETRAYIKNAYYAFDEYGVMLDDWQNASDARVSSGSKIGLASEDKAFYNIEVGNQGTGWVHTYQDEDEGGDVKWFYMESAKKGTVFNANGKDAFVPTSANPTPYHKYVEGSSLDSNMNYLAAKVIKGKTYLFNASGVMQTGVFVFDEDVKMGNSVLKAGVYYFDKTGGASEGRMLTSRRVGVTYDDGETYTYYFTKAGEAARLEINNGSLYDGYGVRVEAKDGNANALVDIAELLSKQPYDSADGALYKTSVKLGTKSYTAGTVIVSSTGKIRNGKITIDDVIYTVSNYVVTEAVDKSDPKTAVDGRFTDAVEE